MEALRLAGLMFALGCVVPASALAGAWSVATRLSESDMVEPKVGTGPSGESIVVFRPRGPSEGEPGATIEAAVRPPGGVFAQPTAVTPGPATTGKTAFGHSGHTAVLWSTAVNGGVDERRLAMRPPGGSFNGPLDVPRGSELAVDGQGNTTLLIHEPSYPPSSEPARLSAVTIAADGTVGPIREVARQRFIVSPAITADAAGITTVAWRGTPMEEEASRGHVYVASAASGGEFTPPKAVPGSTPPSGGSYGGATRVESNARGDTLVMWLSTSPVDPSAGAPVPWGAFRPMGGTFQSAEPVTVPTDVAQHPRVWDFALAADGSVIVAWSDAISVAYSYRPPSGSFEPARAPAPYPKCCSGPYPPHLLTPSVGFDLQGNAMIVYAVNEEHDMHLEAVRKPSGRDYGPPERVYTGEHVYDPDVALDAAGNAVAAWSVQERMSWSPDRRDRGIYAARYDATALPVLRGLDIAGRRRKAFAFRASATGKVTIDVERLGAGSRAVPALRKLAFRGRNVLPLGQHRLRRLSRPGRYRATIRGRAMTGERMKPTRVRFGALRLR